MVVEETPSILVEVEFAVWHVQYFPGERQTGYLRSRISSFVSRFGGFAAEKSERRAGGRREEGVVRRVRMCMRE